MAVRQLLFSQFDTLNKHNLTHLANKKPGLIEKRMQDATDKLWDDLESVTSDITP